MAFVIDDTPEERFVVEESASSSPAPPEPGVVRKLYRAWKEGYDQLYPEGGPIETLKGYGKGFVEGGTLGAVKMEEGTSKAEKAGRKVGEFVGVAAPVTGAIKVGGALTKGLKSYEALSTYGKGAVDAILGATIYKAAEGASQQKAPLETLKEIPVEAASWLVLHGAAYGVSKGIRKGALKKFVEVSKQLVGNERGGAENPVLSKIRQLQSEGKSLDEIRAFLTPEEKLSLTSGGTEKLFHHKMETKSGIVVDKLRSPLTAYAGLKKRVDAGKATEGDVKALDTALDTAITQAKDIVEKFPKHFDDVTGLFRKEGLDFKSLLLNEQGATGLFSKKSKSISTDPVIGMFDRTQVARENLDKHTLKEMKQKFVRAIVDVSGNVTKAFEGFAKSGSREARKVIIKKDLSAGATPRGQQILEEFEGKYLNGFSRDMEEQLFRFIEAKGIVDVAARKPGLKHPENLAPAQFEDFILNFPIKSGLKPDQVKQVRNAADGYFKIMPEMLKEKLDSGIIRQEAYDALVDNLYSPRKFMKFFEAELDKVGNQMYGKLISVAGSDIKALKEGSTDLLFNDAKALLARVVQSTQSYVFRNNAAKALLDFAKSDPTNGIVRAANVVGKTKAGGLVYEDAPVGFTTINAMVKGEPVPMFMPHEFAKEWVKSDAQISTLAAETLRFFSGSTLLKATATGYNPAFALANFFRDVGLVWMTREGKEAGYSAFAPKFLMQMGADMAKVLPDVLMRKGRVLDYINEGGGMNLMTHYGRIGGTSRVITPGLHKGFRALGDVLSYAGETSELLTRMALRERAIKSGAAGEEATWLARTYLDFYKGGNVTKVLDTFIPYVGANVQGTRSIWRGIRSDPKRASRQIGQLMGVSAALYYANTSTDAGKRMMEGIDDSVKEANFIIGLPWLEHKDAQGNLVSPYFKIPKDYGQRIFTTLPEAALEYFETGKLPSKQVTRSIQDFVSLESFTKLAPSMNAYWGYALNKNFFTGRDIWKLRPGQDINALGYDPTQEFYKGDRATSGAFVELGGTTGLSPERLKYAAGQLVPGTNPYVGMLDLGYDAASKALSDEQRIEMNKSVWEKALKFSAAGRFAGISNPHLAAKSETSQIQQESIGGMVIQDREVDDLTRQFINSNMESPEVYDKLDTYIKEQPAEDQDRLTKRVEKTIRYKDIPKRAFWINTAELRPEARALAFWAEYNRVSDEEKTQMYDLLDSGTIKGYIDKDGRFKKTLRELQQNQESQNE